MKVRLLYPDRNVDPEARPPWNAEDLIRDLQLEPIFGAMAGDDKVIDEAVRRALTGACANGIDTLRYRQRVLDDCLRHPGLVRRMYAITVETRKTVRSARLGINGKLSTLVLYSATDLLNVLTDRLATLRRIADRHGSEFASPGFRQLLGRLRDDLTDADLQRIRFHLGELRFRHGFLVSAGLGRGNRGSGYLLRRLAAGDRSRVKRLFTTRPPHYRFEVSEHDEKGNQALRVFRDRQLQTLADVLRQTALDVYGFFETLHAELAFYVGCLNLAERLVERGLDTVCPSLHVPAESGWRVEGLYDVALALSSPEPIVTNAVNAGARRTVVVTGANQGGKSTFLRSVGQAQLMAQAGLFVGASTASLGICDGVFTHFRREEDTTMRRGKLDEELERLSRIVDALTSQSMLLSNESCAATNQREGGEILLEIASALRDHGVRAFYVTHLFEFASAARGFDPATTLLLRAERRSDGIRTFRIVEGVPQETSYGADLYARIFGFEARERPGGGARE